MLLSTSAGVHALDKGWIEVAHSLGATWWEMVRTVVIPGIRAHIATGFRVALGVAWVVIVPGEMLGVDSGLGYAILDARDRLAYSEMMGIILVIGAIGFILDRAFQYVVAGTRTAGPIRGSSPITSRLGPAPQGGVGFLDEHFGGGPPGQSRPTHSDTSSLAGTAKRVELLKTGHLDAIIGAEEAEAAEAEAVRTLPPRQCGRRSRRR